MCHQAGYNRIEYVGIAPKLNKLGYNCLAIDQRSGGAFAEKQNKTAVKAKEMSLNAEMIDAQQDISAAIDYLNKKFNKKVILFGSSYSASLVLLEGNSNEKVSAVIGFSPGDYFENKAPSLATVFSNIEKPYLITSSKAEAEVLTTLIEFGKQGENQKQFIPEIEGYHGAKVLWEGQKGAEEYWAVIHDFLQQIK